MLLHDNIVLFVKFKAVVKSHCEVKLLHCILNIKCIFVMAESDKTLIGDGNLSNNNKNHGIPSIVPNSLGAVPPDTLPTQLAAVSEPSTLKRKQTSFQITSVTVKGSRLSTDGGDDSADDLDDSHASSDVLDCSRTTDDQFSEDNNNPRNDDTSNLSPSINFKSKKDESVLQNPQVSTFKHPFESDKQNIPSGNSLNVEVNPPTLPDQCQHRFKIVKIVSSEPFKRGRWLCMDFMDPPAPVVEAKPEVSDISTHSMQLMSSSISDSIPSDRVAHIYEISPSDSYPGSISVAVGSDQIQQPMYGIFLPINNGHPFITGMHSQVTAAPVQKEVVIQESQRPVAISNEHSIKQANQVASDHIKTFPSQIAHVVPGIVASQGVSMVTMPQVLPTTQGVPSVPIATISQIVPSSQGIPVATMSQIGTASQVTPAASQKPLLTQSVPVTQVSQSESMVMPQTNIQAQRLPTTVVEASGVAHMMPSLVSTQESQPVQPHMQNVSSAQSVSIATTENRTEGSNKAGVVHSSSHTSEFPQTNQLPLVQSTTLQQTSIAQVNIPELSPASGKKPDVILPNHADTKEVSPPSTNAHVSQEVTTETPSTKGDTNGEETAENVPSGTSTVAIDNKIEQAMDLVKSHLMFAVREEVDVLKEKITELMDRISQLEYENTYLRANATQQTLEQLNQTQLLQQQQHQHQNTSSIVSINSISQQPPQQEHLNTQNQQQPS